MFSYSHPMLVPMILILVVAPIGAIDVIYYHLWKFKLFKQPASRKEMITHLVRGILFATGALLLFNFEPHGVWFWVVGLILILDFLNSLVDVALEKSSRNQLGGVPSLEYVVHTIGSTFGGAIAASFLILGWQYQFQPTELAQFPPNSIPSFLLVQGLLLVAGCFLLTMLECFLYCKSVAVSQ